MDAGRREPVINYLQSGTFYLLGISDWRENARLCYGGNCALFFTIGARCLAVAASSGDTSIEAGGDADWRKELLRVMSGEGDVLRIEPESTLVFASMQRRGEGEISWC